MSQKIFGSTEEVNLSHLKAISDGDIAFMKEIVSAFIAEMPGTIIQFKLFLDDEDWKSIASAAHRIKPSLQIMGLNASYELAKEIELNGKSGKVDKMREHLKYLSQTIEKATKKLQQKLEQEFSN